jgi:squalene-hopene/tetraprenyl-beta-curcumene cyclase
MRFAMVGLAGCLVTALADVGERVRAEEPGSWSRAAAAAYLDARQDWWMDWPTAARDHGTFCVSCHTAMPYALARTALRTGAEQSPVAVESRLLKNVEKRVTAWDEIEPFYSDEAYRAGKTSESRGTEAILNALILANRDARAATLSDAGRQAFANLWAQQVSTGDTAGAWPWLDFGLEPWETQTAQYYGAALAAVAIGGAPGGYASTPGIQPAVTRLREYLGREADRQHLFNRLTVLWASDALPGVLDRHQRRAIIAEAMGQQRADGGWSLSSLGMFDRRDGSALETASDGYATGLVTYALQRAGVMPDDPGLERGLAWLRAHQDPDGSWPASSLNKERDPTSDRGRFMRDAATAYAVLALTAGG